MRFSRISLIFFVLVGLDQLSKFLITSSLTEGSSIELLPILNFTLIFNSGIAFSLFDDNGLWGRWVLVGLVALVLIYLVRILLKEKNLSSYESLALVLIFCGGAGNLIDRIFLGHVVDFIHVFYQNYSFYVFNFADSYITIGVTLYLIYILFLGEDKEADAN
jgi:signal peptidase II|tara:strand:+ start:1843 stop:2328 length:486 start_codon:yes stop_codon:yes gene_type:complete